VPFIGSVTFVYPVDWVDANRPIGGATYASIDGNTVTQKVLDTGITNKAMTLKLSWINHSQYQTLYGYYNSVSTYSLQIVSGGAYYTVAFQSGADAFDFTPIVPEIPYSYRSLSDHTLTGSYYDGTIKLVCLGVTGG
jgi:hypothetical protein